ncbi:ATP-binding protein [Streptomyces europaeiscabiei]|uniref:ATP-binding protein n=1 Tax=Streptomyces europaeiscabiei TaxID=146819 RepID=UPI002E127651|nr:ATP-binding protein [Streptomyces europaeiscabiei]
MSRKPWDLHFLAEPEEVADLRRVLRIHLGLWGLDEVVDAAQLCVSELVSNVITHVGPGTPTTLAISMKGTRLRIEVHDPDTRALPTLLNEDVSSESGRGMELITFTADHWGVQLLADRKVTWCELSTKLTPSNSHVVAPGVMRAEALLDFCPMSKRVRVPSPSKLSVAVAQDAMVGVISDFLLWLRAHGCDPEDVLDQAQSHYEAQIRARQ